MYASEVGSRSWQQSSGGPSRKDAPRQVSSHRIGEMVNFERLNKV